MQHVRILMALVSLSFACSGGDCSCLSPIPGGFPAAERRANAIQARITQNGLATLAAEPTELVRGLLGGSLALDVPSSCGGDLEVCCVAGEPVSPCGALSVDAVPRPGDQPRVELRPASGASRLDLTMRLRVRTESDVPITLPVVGACGLRVDSSGGTVDDFRIDVPISFMQDPTSGTTRLALGTVVLSQLATDDIELTGSIACSLANFGTAIYIDLIADIFADALRDEIDRSTCQRCAGGDVASCGTFATSCEDGVCLGASGCVQELGQSGRLSGDVFFRELASMVANEVDLYEVAGTSATTNANGIALSLLGGARPSSTARRCGPPAPPRTYTPVPISSYFQGNTRPDTGAVFDLGIGFHVSHLDELLYAAYESGLLCQDVSGGDAVTTDVLASSIPSLAILAEENSAVHLGFRPQAPPTITLGANTFVDDGQGNLSVDEPLLDVRFEGVEIDVFVPVRDQPIRVLTLVTDVSLPIGARVENDGSIVPVLGASPEADVAVIDHEALSENEDVLALVAPLVVARVRAELVRGVGAYALPQLAGFDVHPSAVTAVDGDAFVAIFADFALPSTETGARVAPGVPARTDGASPTEPTPRAPGPLPPVGTAFVALAVIGIVRRRDVLSRGAFALFALFATGALIPACDCGGGPKNTPACGDVPCLPNDLAPGALGRWSSVDSGSRTVVTSYDGTLGDLVLIELAEGEQQRFVIDGVPDETPTYEPSGYRGGITTAGPDVGAWSSVELVEDVVQVAYQDRDRRALRFARETSPHVFTPFDVDVPAGAEHVGLYASLATSDAPAIAYLATAVPGDGGMLRNELRLARSSVAGPTSSADFSVVVVASAAYVATPAPSAVRELPRGPGLFATLLALPDGRFVIVSYDRDRTALVAHVESAPSSNVFTETVLDGDGPEDRGLSARAVMDDEGVIHVAYQDGAVRDVRYLRFVPGGAITREIADDGLRAGDRPHPIGAGLALSLEGARVRIAYQDAAAADVEVATREGGIFTHAALATGPALDGFAIALAPRGPGPLVWNRVRADVTTPDELVVRDTP